MGKKTLLGLTVFLLLITSFYAGYTLRSNRNNATFTISGGIYQGKSSYTVWTNGSYYFVKDAFDVLSYSGMNLSHILNAIVGSFRVIYFQSRGVYDIFYLSNPVVIPSGTMYLTFKGDNIGYAWLQLTDGANCDMFRIEAGSHMIHFQYLHLHGRNLHQTATSHGIHFLPGASTTSDIIIEKCSIVNFKGAPIYVEGRVSASYIIDNYIEDSEDAAIRMAGLYGSEISRNHLWNCLYGIKADHKHVYPVQDNIITDNIIYGGHYYATYGIYLYNSSNNIISRNQISSCQRGIYANLMYYSEISENCIMTIYYDGMALYSLQFCRISNNNIFGVSQAGNGLYDALHLGDVGSGNCDSNLIVANMISSSNWALKSRYGIYLNGQYNAIIGCHVTGSLTANIYIASGSNNHVHSCFNGTSWIT